MKLNNKVYRSCSTKIGNLSWKIYLVDHANRNLYDDGESKKEADKNDGAFGICLRDVCKIYISDKLSFANFKRTIIHEITHAVLYTYGLLASKAELDEEEVCNFMEIHMEEIKNISDKIFERLIEHFLTSEA